VRLNKFLASAGVASRRKCDELISGGQVTVNGESGDLTGFQVDPEKDTVLFRGKKVVLPKNKYYYMLNKPSGYVSTCSDDKGRETVLQIVKDCDARLFPVGRLDCDTEGLLILTDDGDLAYRLTHPKHEVEKTYLARVRGSVTEDKITSLREGVLLDGRRTAKSRVSVRPIGEKTAEITIAIHEGRNRQVRRMLEAMGLDVLYLKRESVGSLTVKGLKAGEYRPLTQGEIDYLKSL
jgi:23S rRNA pseudouridine2605 synthase